MTKDSDIAEVGEALDKARKDRKTLYRSGPMLEDIAKVQAVVTRYEMKNNDEHMIVHHLMKGKMIIVDYWPSTKRWIQRGTKTKGFGADRLIEYLTKEQ